MVLIQLCIRIPQVGLRTNLFLSNGVAPASCGAHFQEMMMAIAGITIQDLIKSLRARKRTNKGEILIDRRGNSNSTLFIGIY